MGQVELRRGYSLNTLLYDTAYHIKTITSIISGARNERSYRMPVNIGLARMSVFLLE